jgi:hypothetical protein
MAHLGVSGTSAAYGNPVEIRMSSARGVPTLRSGFEMPGRARITRASLAVIAAGLGVLIAAVIVLLTRSGAPPTISDLNMPVPRAPLDRTLVIGARPGVSIGDGTRLEIESPYGQFRGHWWWNKGWVYLSGQALPGSRIQVHIDSRSLTISETPDAQAVSQIGRYGPKTITGDDIQVSVVRFGIGATLFATRTQGGPFPGRHVADQLEARAWSERGLTITRDKVASSPPNRVPCPGTQPQVSGWTWGCRILGQPPLVSDLQGRFPSSRDAIVQAFGMSLTATPNGLTQLPTDSMRIEW